MPVKIWKQQVGLRKIKCPSKFLLDKFQMNLQSLASQPPPVPRRRVFKNINFMIICSSPQGTKKKSKLTTKARSEIQLHSAFSQSYPSKKNH